MVRLIRSRAVAALIAAGWAVAGDTPFTWTKQVAGSYGGCRNGMVVHWPKRITAKGELRSQSWRDDPTPALDALANASVQAAQTIKAACLKEMPDELTAANDLEFRTGADSPTLRIDDLTVNEPMATHDNCLLSDGCDRSAIDTAQVSTAFAYPIIPPDRDGARTPNRFGLAGSTDALARPGAVETGPAHQASSQHGRRGTTRVAFGLAVLRMRPV